MISRTIRPRPAGRSSAWLALTVAVGCGGSASTPGPAPGPGVVAESAQSPDDEIVIGAGGPAAGFPVSFDSARVSGPDPEWQDPEAVISGRAESIPYGPLTLQEPVSPLPSGFPVHVVATAGVDGPPWQGRLRWESSDPLVLRVSQSGVVTGYAPGSAWITATPIPGPAGDLVVDSEPEAEINAAVAPPAAAVDTGASADFAPAAAIQLTVVQDPARILTVSPAEALVTAGQVLHLTAGVRAIDGRELEDDRVHWSSTSIDADRVARIDPDGAFVAPASGTWLVTATRGGLSASSVVSVTARSNPVALEPLASALPPGPLSAAAGVRVFEGMDGRDWAWVWTDVPARLQLWDVTDPALPVFVRTITPGADRVNDLEIGSGAAWAVAATSGAAAGAPAPDSRTAIGLLVFDLSSPSDPRVMTTIRDGLAAGASTVAVDREQVWAGSIADGALVGFDLGDARSPVRIGTWKQEADRISDLEVRNGLAILARWNAGLTIVDVGAGIAGGSPAQPVLVSEFRSPGPDMIEDGSAHAFRVRRWRDWILLGESIAGCAACAADPSGGLRLIDVTDLRRPAQRAWYQVPEAGVRDLDVDPRAARLAAAFGTGGVRLLDLSGELRGDLNAQGREIASSATGSWWPGVPTRSLARGARSLKGSLFVADTYAGLRVFRIVTATDDQ